MQGDINYIFVKNNLCNTVAYDRCSLSFLKCPNSICYWNLPEAALVLLIHYSIENVQFHDPQNASYSVLKTDPIISKLVFYSQHRLKAFQVEIVYIKVAQLAPCMYRLHLLSRRCERKQGKFSVDKGLVNMRPFQSIKPNGADVVPFLSEHKII